MIEKQNPYGMHCGLCRNAVPVEAAICAACGAAKSTRAGAMSPGAHLVRQLAWLGSIGLLIFLTGFMTLKPWNDPLLLHGSRAFCYSEIIAKFPTPYEFMINEKTLPLPIANEACEDVVNLEVRKADLLRTNIKSFSKEVVVKAGKTYTVREPLPTPPGFMNLIEVLARSLGALAIGCLLLRWAGMLWAKLFGRMGDPLWVKKP